jgi:hypothetical protein
MDIITKSGLFIFYVIFMSIEHINRLLLSFDEERCINEWISPPHIGKPYLSILVPPNLILPKLYNIPENLSESTVWRDVRDPIHWECVCC